MIKLESKLDRIESYIVIALNIIMVVLESKLDRIERLLNLPLSMSYCCVRIKT